MFDKITDELSIYLHWPFCESKCPYCDFNSYVADSVNCALWKRAYLDAIRYYRMSLGFKNVRSIFVGGGTPSYAPLDVLYAILNEISANFGVSHTTEISIEVNPCSSDATKISAWSKMGFNRISIGVQSFNDKNLSFLGRRHTSSRAMSIVETAKQYFNNVSIDLIYALPNQTIDSLINDIEVIAGIRPQHVSLYQLTVYDDTPLAQIIKDKTVRMPQEDESANLYLVANCVMSINHFNAYEVSNYALDGWKCKHNIVYWKCGDYIAIGPGAHGRYTIGDGERYATQDHSSPQNWLDSVALYGHGIRICEQLSAEDQRVECILMGMRLHDGISLDLLTTNAKMHLAELLEYDFITINKRHNTVAATVKGMLIVDTITKKLIL